MSTSDNVGYYQPSRGSISGFDSANLPQGNPNLSVVGWSREELRRFLLNADAMNFPSNEWILRVEELIRSHIDDKENPHQTLLDQIVGDITEQLLGSTIPGTPPREPPFFAFESSLSLPIDTILPFDYATHNFYRRVEGGWLVNQTEETSKIGTDYLYKTPGLPLFSSMTNVTPSNWRTLPDVAVNTAISALVDPSIAYPFEFTEVVETPTIDIFGIDIPSTQDNQSTYVTSFFLIPAELGGFIRIYQPSDAGSFMDVNLTTAATNVVGDDVFGAATLYPDGSLRVSFGFISLVPNVDNKLRVVHHFSNVNPRQGSFGRKLFAIGNVQTAKSALNPPAINNLDQPAAAPTLVAKLASATPPANLNRLLLTLTFFMHRIPTTASVNDSVIMSFGPILITRDQTNIRISINSNPYFTVPIINGINVITLNYSPTELAVKTIFGDRQTLSGTYPPVPTSNLSFGPFGGYLHSFALYASNDTQKGMEYLTNG